MHGLKGCYMNYIVFVNKRDSEKLAMTTNANTYDDLNKDECDIINKICDSNDYRFLIKSNVNSKVPRLEDIITL